MTPAEPYTHRGTPAVRAMVEQAPATGGLALWARHRDVAADELDVPVANDGRTLYYAPAFEALPRAEQVGRVAHEVVHVEEGGRAGALAVEEGAQARGLQSGRQVRNARLHDVQAQRAAPLVGPPLVANV